MSSNNLFCFRDFSVENEVLCEGCSGAKVPYSSLLHVPVFWTLSLWIGLGVKARQGRAAFNASDFPWGFWQGYSFISRLHSPCNEHSMALVLCLLCFLNRAHFTACVKAVCPPAKGRDTQGQGHGSSFLFLMEGCSHFFYSHTRRIFLQFVPRWKQTAVLLLSPPEDPVNTLCLSCVFLGIWPIPRSQVVRIAQSNLLPVN